MTPLKDWIRESTTNSENDLEYPTKIRKLRALLTTLVPGVQIVMKVTSDSITTSRPKGIKKTRTNAASPSFNTTPIVTATDRELTGSSTSRLSTSRPCELLIALVYPASL